MDLEVAIRERRSIRKFKQEPVSDDALRRLLETARWAPSWTNTQNWSVFVVRGDTLERLRAAYREKVATRAERRFDVPPHKPEWPEAMRARTQQLFDTRQAATGIPYPTPFPADLYHAPCVVFFAIDERLQPEYACFDLGLLVENFCLAAHASGLGTCIMALAVGYADVLHGLIPEAAGKRFVVGVPVGVPEAEAPINRFERRRADLDEIVTWR